jgi:hypothetical protein
VYNRNVSLTACSDLSPADWITRSDLPSEQLVTLGPAGFAAYARLRFLPDPAYQGQRENDAEIPDDEMPEAEALGVALEVLRRHTRTPDDCYFCVWDGWGPGIDSADMVDSGDSADSVWLADIRIGMAEPGWYPTALPGIAPTSPSSGPHVPKVVVPHREYFLFQGALSDASDLPDRAAFIWPADHAWCITHDVDPHWAGIGAGTVAIDQLVSDPRLDVVPTDPRAPQPRYR